MSQELMFGSLPAFYENKMFCVLTSFPNSLRVVPSTTLYQICDQRHALLPKPLDHRVGGEVQLVTSVTFYFSLKLGIVLWERQVRSYSFVNMCAHVDV